MSPAEAGEELEEPDWLAVFQDFGGEDSAFDATLSLWRRRHWTPIEINGELKKLPASATEGIIALASIGVMPPQSLRERPGGLFEEQSDDHCWILSQGRSWRILGVEDGMLMLNSFGEGWQIDLKRARWNKYVAAKAATLTKADQSAPATIPEKGKGPRVMP